MIKLHDMGTLREFADGDAIIAHFGLTRLDAGTLSGLRAASDAGFPLHAAIDPYADEINDVRVLMTDTSSDELRQALAERHMDI